MLNVVNGVITHSEDSGRFDGWLPSVGNQANFSINSSTVPTFTSDLDLDFDLGDFGSDVDVSFDFSSDGAASIAVPEPTTVFGLLAVSALGLNLKRKKQS